MLVGFASATAAPADAKAPHDPLGALDAVKVVGTSLVRVTGYAIDKDTRGSLMVKYYVDGKYVKKGRANKSRATVAKRWPRLGRKHGLNNLLRVGEGRHTICVTARNRGKGKSVRLKCRTVTVKNNPTGSLSSLVQTATGLRVAGSTADPNAKTAKLRVTLTLNGATKATVVAGAGKAGHSFSADVAVPDGTYRVCGTAQNRGWGRSSSIGCRSITLNHRPVGAITGLKQSPGGFTVAGWAKDPDSTARLALDITRNGQLVARGTANGANTARQGYGFRLGATVPDGPSKICVKAHNVGPGKDRYVDCRTITLNYSPIATVTGLKQSQDGAIVAGWATDPDTTEPVPVRFTVDGVAPAEPATGVTADRTEANMPKPGYSFRERVTPIATNGPHEICAIATNLSYGTHDSIPTCRTTTFNFSPVGSITAAPQTVGNATVQVSGSATDPNTTAPIQVHIYVDGAYRTALTTAADHTFGLPITVTGAEQLVCAYGINVEAGGNTKLGCVSIWASAPGNPGAPTNVRATAQYGQATVTWASPAHDGGAPIASYTVVASPGGRKATIAAPATKGVVTGLALKGVYSFTVTATNLAGKTSTVSALSPAVTIPTAPPAQTTPAPVSTSRYVRNLKDDRTDDLAAMRAQGAADAAANPAGHRYVVLLDIGGQDQVRGGVVLSAGIRYVSYGWLVKGLKAYVDGYASKQRVGAPVEITIGTNNDMDVNYTAGKDWADKVVDPVRAYAAAKTYPGLTISGANDIEPGFDADYAATKKWLDGYLAATTARFVFNGSADGCSWTATNRGCNNSWTMSGLHWLAGGAAPSRITNLPQIYNLTMPKQWKYISLTGVDRGLPKLSFGGPLTELVACRQAGSCGSIDGTTAWRELWNQLRSDSRSKLSTMPWAADLRIDLK
jgi:hypothetical protein